MLKGRLQQEESSDLGPFMSRDSSALVLECSPAQYEEHKNGRMRRINTNRSLGTLAVVSITYFYGCGGPIGTEQLVTAGGPLVAIISMLLYPLFMTLPYAWIVAELCSAFPEDGGFAIWVLHAFGPFWACQVGYWSWVSGLIVGAIIPSLLIDLIAIYLDIKIESALVFYFLRVAVAIVLMVPTLLGTKCVSRVTIAMMGCTLAPFLLFTVWAYAKGHELNVLGDVRHSSTTVDASTGEVEMSGSIDIEWGSLINTLFWNYDGINIASVFGGEVQNPARVYTRAIFITIILSVLTVVLPIPAAIVGSRTAWPLFGRGMYLVIAQQIGGHFLELLVIISAACAALGLYVSSIYCKAFELSGMAESDLVPRAFARRNQRFDSPHISILTSVICVIFLSAFNFARLLPVSNVFACAVELLILMSAIRLRIKLPYIPRPTRVPGGIPVLVGVTVVVSLMLLFIAYSAFRTMYQALMITVCLLPGLSYGGYESYQRHQSSLLN